MALSGPGWPSPYLDGNLARVGLYRAMIHASPSPRRGSLGIHRAPIPEDMECHVVLQGGGCPQQSTMVK